MVKEKEALETGIQSYIYAYPLVMMGQTLRLSTNVATPEGTSAPMGQFAHVREYPTPEYKTIVAPNADTLYSVLWLDGPGDKGVTYLLNYLNMAGTKKATEFRPMTQREKNLALLRNHG